MKKKLIICIFVLLFIVVGCSKKERTMEYLLDRYVEAFSKASMDAVKDMFPPFYIEYSKNSLNKEKLESQVKQAKELYGDDLTITYKIGENTKLNDEELKKVNEEMAKTYGAKEDASECYSYKISVMFKGSKKEDPLTYNSMGYCNYNGTWYLVRID